MPSSSSSGRGRHERAVLVADAADVAADDGVVVVIAEKTTTAWSSSIIWAIERGTLRVNEYSTRPLSSSPPTSPLGDRRLDRGATSSPTAVQSPEWMAAGRGNLRRCAAGTRVVVIVVLSKGRWRHERGPEPEGKTGREGEPGSIVVWSVWSWAILSMRAGSSGLQLEPGEVVRGRRSPARRTAMATRALEPATLIFLVAPDDVAAAGRAGAVLLALQVAVDPVAADGGATRVGETWMSWPTRVSGQLDEPLLATTGCCRRPSRPGR
jgi:hypothetical protein